MFSQVPAWEGGAFQGGLTTFVGAERWVFHRKTAVKEITHDWRNVHTNSEALFIQSLLLVWGLDQSMGRRPAALTGPGSLLKRQNSRHHPRPPGSESAF